MLQVYASVQAPGVDPVYANALFDDAAYRAVADEGATSEGQQPLI
jgi:hypothetical protein